MDTKSHQDGLPAVPQPSDTLERTHAGRSANTVSRTTFLNGWKDIAMYVGRGVRTVQRWEALGLPVRRPKSRLRSAVVCTTEEVDAWLESCGNGRIEESSRLERAEDYARLATELSLLRSRLEQLRTENETLRNELDILRAPQERNAGVSPAPNVTRAASRDAA